LKEAVLTLRALEAIVEQWQKEGYKNELDYYVYKEFVSQSTQASDRAYLYQLLKDQFGFFKNNGWEQNPQYGSGGIVRSFSVPLPANASKPCTFHGPREMVEFACGEAPERTTWPEPDTIITEQALGEEVEDSANTEKLRILEEFKQTAEEEIASLTRQVAEFELSTSPLSDEKSSELPVKNKKPGLLDRFKKKK
ncbi:MAG: hypothetical protein HYZ69_00380, partial [Candidatus Colwellbacteria bacterium]|nr:hypothetical protein [Candidatus Colwellbacteria bacterium]